MDFKEGRRDEKNTVTDYFHHAFFRVKCSYLQSNI